MRVSSNDPPWLCYRDGVWIAAVGKAGTFLRSVPQHVMSINSSGSANETHPSKQAVHGILSRAMGTISSPDPVEARMLALTTYAGSPIKSVYSP